MEHVNLQNGSKAPIAFHNEMWRCSVDGMHFISATKKDLIRCITEVRSAVIPEIPVEPPRPIADLMYEQLLKGTLDQKQSARRTLVGLANGGNDRAAEIVKRFCKKPLSHQAKYHAKSIGKDFIDLTNTDLTEHVNDIVLRTKLMDELASHFKLEEASPSKL